MLHHSSETVVYERMQYSQLYGRKYKDFRWLCWPYKKKGSLQTIPLMIFAVLHCHSLYVTVSVTSVTASSCCGYVKRYQNRHTKLNCNVPTHLDEESW